MPFYLVLFYIIINQVGGLSSLIEQVHQAVEAYNVEKFFLEHSDEDDYLIGGYSNYDRALVPSGCRLSLDFTPLDSLSFPLKGYKLYHIIYNPNKLNCGERIQVTSVMDGSRPKKQLFLVAYNYDRERVLYISGGFKKSRISGFFDFNNKQEVNTYLKLKLYNLKIKNWKFEGENNRVIKYSGFSQSLVRTIKIEISQKDFDKIKVSE